MGTFDAAIKTGYKWKVLPNAMARPPHLKVWSLWAEKIS